MLLISELGENVNLKWNGKIKKMEERVEEVENVMRTNYIVIERLPLETIDQNIPKQRVEHFMETALVVNKYTGRPKLDGLLDVSGKRDIGLF